MESKDLATLPLIVIIGPTASGKTALAVELAARFNGEIICADSRTVYIGMDIGTAKPSHEEQKRVPHFGLDLVEPGERFTAADFKRYAEQKIEEIRRRGHIPFLVGGSGLYVDAVVFDYKFGPKADDALRKTLNELSIKELHDYCNEHSVTLPENNHNKRYVVRAIEQKSINTKRRATPIRDCIVVGITTEKVILRTQISLRLEHMFDDGVVEEATILGKKYGWGSEALTGNIYPLIHSYLEKEVTLEEVKVKSTILDWHLAKRQLTWFKRNKFITWLELPEAEVYLSEVLANAQKR